MGWRSWNRFHFDIDQPLIEAELDVLVDKSRMVDGTPTSLAELGYNNGGIDDGWQACDTSKRYNDGRYFHNDTSPNGWPVVNHTLFPDIPGMVKRAHAKGLGINWYMNNCRCSEQNAYPANEANDVAWLVDNGFDGVKLDGCGSSMNTSNWNRLINESNKQPVLTEDGGNIEPPTDDSEAQCPMNMFNFLAGKGFGDDEDHHNVGHTPYKPYINYFCLLSSLETPGAGIHQFLKYPTGFVSRPGCWAFPGDLQVGNLSPEYGATVDDMDQTHFSLWVIMSSPLVLGFDLTNATVLDRVWPIITNTEVLAVSQTWGGHPGRRAAFSPVNITVKCGPKPQYEIWAKPLPADEWAVLLVNNFDTPQVITVNFADVPWTGPAKLRDLYQHKELGTVSDSYTSNVTRFGSVMLKFAKA
jgi:alpha-galactosidase